MFVFGRHGVQEFPAAHAIGRSGPLVRTYTEKRGARGEPAAIIHLADDTMVSLVKPEPDLKYDPQAWPRIAGRAPGVYVRIDAATHAFPASLYHGVSFRLADDEAYVEVTTADRMFISNLLDLDFDETPGEILLAVLRLAPGVIVGDGSKGTLRPVEGEAAHLPTD